MTRTADPVHQSTDRIPCEHTHRLGTPVNANRPYYTGDLDDTVKRDFYEALGVLEYRRFDPTGEYNQALLASDRLVDVKFQPLPINRLGGN